MHYLNIRPCDRMDFVVEEDGRVSLAPVIHDIRELEGFLQRRGTKAVSYKGMTAAVKKRFKPGID
jgi:hypothetical protein